MGFISAERRLSNPITLMTANVTKMAETTFVMRMSLLPWGVNGHCMAAPIRLTMKTTMETKRYWNTQSHVTYLMVLEHSENP